MWILQICEMNQTSWKITEWEGVPIFMTSVFHSTCSNGLLDIEFAYTLWPLTVQWKLGHFIHKFSEASFKDNHSFTSITQFYVNMFISAWAVFQFASNIILRSSWTLTLLTVIYLKSQPFISSHRDSKFDLNCHLIRKDGRKVCISVHQGLRLYQF